MAKNDMVHFSSDVFQKKKAEPKMKEKKALESFRINKKILNIDSNEIFFEITIRIADSMENNIVISRQDLYSQSAFAINAGLPVFDKKLWGAVIGGIEAKLPLSYQHSGLGFSTFNGELIYKADTAIGIDSKYKGAFDVGSKGSLEGWLEIIKNHVQGNLALETMVILGLSAVTIGFLRDRVDGSLMTHIFSDSSKGKTTACELAVSTAGNPFPSTRGTNLQGDYGSTENYRIGMLSNNYGFPIVIDEASKITQKDISNFIYAACNGESRGRLNPDGTPKEVFHWKTSCISNGEGSLLPLCNKNLGIRARLIELQFDTLTESAEQADKIKEGISRHYGWANREIAHHVLENQIEVIECFEATAKSIRAQLEPSDSIGARLAKKLAVVATTAKIANEALPLNFDEKSISGFLVESVLKQIKQTPTNLGERLIDYIIEDLFAHKERYGEYVEKVISFSFAGYEDGETITLLNLPNNCFAVTKEFKEYFEIQFFQNKFEKFLEMAGFTNKEICLKALENIGYLVVDKDGHKAVKRKINDFSLRVYVIRLPISLLKSEGMELDFDSLSDDLLPEIKRRDLNASKKV